MYSRDSIGIPALFYGKIQLVSFSHIYFMNQLQLSLVKRLAMKKGVFIFIGVILALILILSTCSNSDEKANKLYSEAVSLVQEAKKVESKNVLEALQMYKEADKKIQILIAEHAKTKTAVAVQSAEKKIDGLTVKQLREQIIPTVEQKAKATQDLGSLLLFFLEKAEDGTYSKCIIFYEISKAYRLKGDKKTSRDFLKKLVECTKLIPDEKKYLQVSLDVITAVEYYHHREIEKARLIINNAVTKTHDIEHKKMKERLLLSIVSAYAEISQFDKARRLTHKLQDNYLMDAAYFDMADNYAEFQLIDSAFETAREIFSADLKSRAYTNISSQLILQGKEPTAEKYLEYCQESLLDSVEQVDKKVKATLEIAECYRLLGKDRKVNKLIKKIKDEIKQITNYRKSNFLKLELAKLYIRLNPKNKAGIGLMEEAQALAVSFPKNSSIAVAEVALTFADMGNFTRAYKLTHRIEDPQRQLETRVKIAAKQVANNTRINAHTAEQIQQIIQM